MLTAVIRGSTYREEHVLLVLVHSTRVRDRVCMLNYRHRFSCEEKMHVTGWWNQSSSTTRLPSKTNTMRIRFPVHHTGVPIQVDLNVHWCASAQ